MFLAFFSYPQKLPYTPPYSTSNEWPLFFFTNHSWMKICIILYTYISKYNLFSPYSVVLWADKMTMGVLSSRENQLFLSQLSRVAYNTLFRIEISWAFLLWLWHVHWCHHQLTFGSHVGEAIWGSFWHYWDKQLHNKLPDPLAFIIFQHILPNFPLSLRSGDAL